MAYFEKISALPPIPSELPRTQRQRQRRPREERPVSPPGRPPVQNEQDSADVNGFHIDEYA